MRGGCTSARRRGATLTLTRSAESWCGCGWGWCCGLRAVCSTYIYVHISRFRLSVCDTVPLADLQMMLFWRWHGTKTFGRGGESLIKDLMRKAKSLSCDTRQWLIFRSDNSSVHLLGFRQVSATQKRWPHEYPLPSPSGNSELQHSKPRHHNHDQHHRHHAGGDCERRLLLVTVFAAKHLPARMFRVAFSLGRPCCPIRRLRLSLCPDKSPHRQA